MNKTAIINTCDWGSTGKIAKGLQRYLKRIGVDALFCYGRGEKRHDEERFRFCSSPEVCLHALSTKLTGRLNGSSVLATRRLIRELRKRGVDSLYIINLHGHVINERILWDYLAKSNIHIVYVMADESAFLGNCTYRDNCENYKDDCSQCPRITGLAKLICPGASRKAFLMKKKAYEQLSNIFFVGPEFVIQSAKTSPLLTGKRMEIVDEAIDVDINTPRDVTALRKELGIKDDKIVIGCVAPASYPRKGVRYFIEAAKRMEGDDRLVFVQVGYDLNDKSSLPGNYIPIGFVSDQKLLSYYYSLSDLFVFPSLQDTMPNACLDALACGSPLLCFNISGMPYIADDSVMTLVEARNVDQMVEIISATKKKTAGVIKKCREYALDRYDNKKYSERLVSIMNSID